MKLKSIKTKISIILFITTILMNVFSYALLKQNIDNIVSEKVSKEAIIILKNLAVAADYFILNDKDEELTELLNNAIEYGLIDSIDVVDSEENIIARSSKQSENATENIICLPIKDQYTIKAAINDDYMSDLVITSSKSMLVIFSIMNLFILSIIVFIIYRIVIIPLQRFDDIIEKVSKKDFDSYVEVIGRDEFATLAITLNEMIKSIKENITSLKESKKIAENDSQEKMNFLANMSHEIRTPLNSIIGFTSVLLEKKEYELESQELNIIMNSSNHLIDVINDILDIAKLEQHKFELESKEISIRKIIAQINEMFQLKIDEKRLDYNSIVELDVPDYLMGDGYRIKEMIINLISNAIKFTEEGSIKVHIYVKDEYIYISIKDTGIGIPEEKVDVVFEAFSQSEESTTRLYGGTGLGLAISKKIASKMNGDITINSDGISGSEFIISILAIPVESEVYLKRLEGDSIVERWLGVDGSIRDISLDFLKTLPMRIEEIESAIDNNDKSDLEFKVHALKGVVANFNMKSIYDILLSFENTIIENSGIRGVRSYIKSMNKIIDKIPKELLGESTEMQQVRDVANGREITILLAEDVYENRLLIGKILEKSNVQIDYACNGVEAIDLLKKKEYDCILLDIQMPIMSGLDVLNWMKEEKSELSSYIIALTANARKEEKEKYLDMGCDSYIAKPVDKKILRKKISELRLSSE